MNDHEVEVTLTPERIKLYERAMVIGLPAIVVSMYGDRIQKLIDDEREACAKVCEEMESSPALSDLEKYRARFIADAIRARGQA